MLRLLHLLYTIEKQEYIPHFFSKIIIECNLFSLIDSIFTLTNDNITKDDVKVRFRVY